jgi:hypothetical protein
VTADLEELVNALLYEGYALYPYTPGAVKNATPTPFGIVYPPAHAEGQPAAHDQLRLECAFAAEPGAELEACVRFLQSTGDGHGGTERRIDLPRTPLADLAGDGVGTEFEFEGETTLTGHARMSTGELGGGLTRVRVSVHNTTAVAEGAGERSTALRSSLLSTLPLATVHGGRFEAASDHPELESVNTWPVLASDEDDVVMGAAIMLPDHPELAPESKGSLFDGTEIEEALLLHVQTLSDHEREAIDGGDPAVRAMIERAVAATPEDIFRLHGRMTVHEPGDGS